jgi:chromosome partitioning protein
MTGETPLMASIVSFSNQKGGVGKTTSCVNVAASLGMLGYKVMIIDLDPQGITTSGVGISKKVLKGSTRDLLSGKMPVEDIIVETPFQNLSVIPTNTALSGAEFDLFEFDETEKRMKMALEPIKDKYDYILIDCPPSLGMLTINAFTASDGVIVPMQCEFYALEGLSQLMITINRIKRLYNPDLNVSGILITMYNGRLLLSMQVMAELEKHYSDKIFSTKISRNVKLTEAPGFGKPVFYHDKSSKGAKEYLEVAKELSTRI